MTAAQVFGWVVAYWGDILAVILAVVAIVQAIQHREYKRLLPLAGALASAAAKMADLDNEGRREWVADQLAASGLLAKFLTKQQIRDLVEAGWHLIAKPQQPQEAPHE